MNITIILSYGVFQEDNKQYKSYLDKALQIAQNSDLIFTTGGKTNPQLAKQSEAQSVFDYLISQNTELQSKIIREDQSLTTPQNLEFCAKRLKHANTKITNLTIICDSIRAPKVFAQTLQYFNELMRFNLPEEEQIEVFANEVLNNEQQDLTKAVTYQYKNLTVAGQKIGRGIEELSHQVGSTLLEHYFYRYPDLHIKAIEYRLKKWGFKKE